MSTEVVDRHGRVALRGAVGGRHAQPPADRGRPAAEPGGGDAGGGGPPVLRPLRASTRSRSRARCWHNLRAGRLVEGGSTITQQTVKQLIARPRTARGKLREVRARAAARAPAHQARDPRALPERRALRQPDRRRRGGEPRLLRLRRARADARPGGVPGRPAAAAERLQPLSRPGAAPSASGRCSTRMAAQGALDAAGAGHGARASGCASRATRRRFLAPHFVERVRAEAPGNAAPHRDDARRGPAAARARHRGDAPRAPARGTARTTSRSRCSTTPRASGWPGRARATTRTTEHGGAIDGVVLAAPARLGAEAVHVRAGVRARLHAGVRAARRARALRDRARGRPLQPAQLRRRLPRPAARAGGAGGLGERARGVAAVPDGRARPAAAAARRRASRRSTRPRTTTASR